MTTMEGILVAGAVTAAVVYLVRRYRQQRAAKIFSATFGSIRWFFSSNGMMETGQNMMTLDLAEAAPPWQQCQWPADLREWVGNSLLIKLTLAAVQAVASARINRAGRAGQTQGLPPRMMLTLLTFAYAAGIHGSGEIERAITDDPAVNYLSARRNPGAEYLRRFRNQNRELLAGCLGQVCGAVGRMHWAAQATLPWLPGRLAGIPWSWVDGLMQLQCLCEARQRLAQAEREDGGE